MRDRSSERGIALVTALILSTVLVLLVSLTVRYAITSSSLLKIDRTRAEALNVAEGGIEWGVSQFDPSNLSAIATSSRFASGEYTLTARPLAGGRFAIRADAAVPSAASALSTRSVEVVIATGSNPLGNYALATDGDLTLNGSVTFNSSPTTGQGNVHSNQDVYINGGSATFQGAVSATGLVSPGSYPGATGGVTSQAPQVEISGYSSTQITTFATQAQSYGTHAITSPLNGVLNGYYQSYPGYDIQNTTNTSGGTISISGGTVNISGVVFIEGSLNVSGSARIQGDGMIICTQGISISGNPYVEGSTASKLALVSLSSRSPAIDLGGANNIRALMFAPNGNVTVHGNVNMTGVMIARGVGIVQGSVTMTRDTTQKVDLLQIPYWQTVSYHEL